MTGRVLMGIERQTDLITPVHYDRRQPAVAVSLPKIFVGRKEKSRTGQKPSPAVEAQLEDDLQRELNQAFGRSHTARNGRTDHTELVGCWAASITGCGLREVRMVEDVEEFRSEFQTNPLSNVGPLKHCEIEVIDSGSTKIGIDARFVSETPLWWRCKATGVEVLSQASASGLLIAPLDHIGSDV